MARKNSISFIKQNKFVLILVLIGLFIFFNSLFNGFVWDDEELIVNNVIIHSFSNLTSFFAGGAFNSGGTGSLSGVFYKPIMTLCFSLLYTIFGNRPIVFHLFSIIIHIINSILVFFLFKEFFPHLEAKRKELVSFIVSLFFLLHPLYSEVVFYISNFQDLLFMFFGLSAFLLILKKRISVVNILLITFLFLCSLLSKETGLVLIIISSLYSFLFKRKEKGFFWVYIAGFTSVVMYSLMRFGIAKQFFPNNNLAPIARINLVERLINLPKILLFYIQNFFVPINFSVNQNWLVKSLNLREFYIPLIVILVFFTFIFLMTFLLWKKKISLGKLYFFFLSWFILGLLPHIQIFPLDATATGRWFYLPSLGLFGMISVLVLLLTDKLKSNQRKTLLIIIILIVTFYSKEIKLSGDNFSLENNLGVELYRIGKLDEAGVHWERSVNLAPYWWTNFNNLGVYWQNKNDLEKAEGYYLKSIENGNYYLAFENYALVLLKQKKYTKAKEFLNTNIKYFPQNTNMIQLLALSYYFTGDTDTAIKVVQYLIDNSPTENNKKLLDLIQKGGDLSNLFD
ncbi:MAG: hypothetical protein UR59_C0003G0007 [Candidatus Woesebacteria bacterium GW2011_GWA1_34_41]|nr:MAG: hypothetical protein UR59_C0003G0007 [Candidatus Woesebacteria bacterium GW2011_GWA1_34_41]